MNAHRFLRELSRPLLLASSLLLASACSSEAPVGSATRAIVETPCQDDAQCPSGFECEIEVEHGVTTSFCQAHDEDGGCPAGLELEVEHGQEFCRAHGGGDDDEANDDDNDDDVDAGPADPGAGTCATDADCPAGYECETEVEHGQTVSFCKPHGGN